MEKLTTILFFAVFIKAIIDYIANWFVNGKVEWKQIFSCISGIALAFAFNLNGFETLGIQGNYYVGLVLTGVVISGGSNLVNDAFASFGKNSVKNIVIEEKKDEIADIVEKG